MTGPIPSLVPEVIAQRVIRQATPGAIILLHDGLGTRADIQAENMVAALPAIIETLQAQGYRFVTVLNCSTFKGPTVVRQEAER